MGIIIENVTKTIQGVNILNNVNLVVNEGDFSVLLAPTGSGKTTLLRIIAGIEKPTSGKIYFDGVDVTNLSVQNHNIAMVHQQFVNYPSYTVYENIASPLRVSKKKYSKKEIDDKVRANAKLLGISGILDALPEQISGGQQQRTAIARALIKGTKYVFLDEPLANLDYKLREELRGELKLIFRKKGGAMIYATPEPIDAMGMASHVGFIYKGEIIQYGPVKEVYKNPKFLEVGEYFSNPTMNILEGKKIEENNRQFIKVTNQFKIDVSSVNEKLVKDSYFIGVRAHDISMKNKKDCFVEIDGIVELTEAVGSDTEIHIEHFGKEIIALVDTFVSYEIGETVKLYINPNRFYIFDKETHKLCAKTGKEN
jgi:glycerol transport system ATP-binding protein